MPLNSLFNIILAFLVLSLRFLILDPISEKFFLIPRFTLVYDIVKVYSRIIMVCVLFISLIQLIN